MNKQLHNSHLIRAADLINQAQFKAAIDQLELALAIESENADALSKLSYCYMMMDEYGHSLRSAKMALKQDSQNTLALHTIGQICLMSDQFEKAEGYARKAISFAPDEAGHFCLLAQALVRQDFQADALAAAKKAVQLSPESAESRASLASTYLQCGDLRDATTHINAALELKPASRQALSIKAVIDSMLGNFDNVKETVNQLNREYADHPTSTTTRTLANMGSSWLFRPWFFYNRIFSMLPPSGRKVLAFLLIKSPLFALIIGFGYAPEYSKAAIIYIAIVTSLLAYIFACNLLYQSEIEKDSEEVTLKDDF